MIRGLYTAASGMLAGQKRQEILTNNLSNANTVGYKAEEQALRSFPEVLINRVRELEGTETIDSSIPRMLRSTPVGPLSGGVYTHEIISNFSQGDISYSGNPFDLAIANDLANPATGQKANLFFTVQSVNGDRLYTRDGRFTTNANGQLSTYQGDLVLDANGSPIAVDGRQLEVLPDGRIRLTDLANPDDVTEQRLGLAMVENPSNTFIKGENGYFRTQDGQGLPMMDPNAPNMTGWNYSILQGGVESSNVDVSRVMTQMIESLRYYEANQKVLQATDSTLQKAVTEIGRV